METLNYVNEREKGVKPVYANNIPNCSITKLSLYCKKTKQRCGKDCEDLKCIKIEVV